MKFIHVFFVLILPILIVACFEITSGDKGVNLVTSTLATSVIVYTILNREKKKKKKQKKLGVGDNQSQSLYKLTIGFTVVSDLLGT